MDYGPESLMQALEELRQEALPQLEAASSTEQLEEWRILYLGRRDGRLTQVLRLLKELPTEDKPAVGFRGNEVKLLLEGRLAQRESELKNSELELLVQSEQLDVTLPGRPVGIGRLHPITKTLREICDAFVAMGFQVVEGPEVEWDYYNFEKLNIPKGHPARDMWNSLWIDFTDSHGEHPMLLRTHTSPMQARVMEQTQPPVRVVVPGKCYRYEATDATHEWQFFQVEGLAVDEGITFADLKGTLYEFARRTFGPERQVRFRCDYFPFVEPGVDVAIDCFACGGKGYLVTKNGDSAGESPVNCRLCKESGWIEIMGAGMVHPRVLETAGYDSSRYTGFAFGIGVERIALLKHNIPDIRLFYANDMRFLRQF